jgi:hypothetical protein
MQVHDAGDGARGRAWGLADDAEDEALLGRNAEARASFPGAA